MQSEQFLRAQEAKRAASTSTDAAAEDARKSMPGSPAPGFHSGLYGAQPVFEQISQSGGDEAKIRPLLERALHELVKLFSNAPNAGRLDFKVLLMHANNSTTRQT